MTTKTWTITEINEFTDAHMALLKARNINKKTNIYANDLLLDRHKLLPISNERILGILKTMYPDFGLYSLPSLDWRTTANYIAKARGKYGDVVISWI
jgi:hypothetical protein